jgi:hypothetical protein
VIISSGLEFVSRATTIDTPPYDVNGVVAVDILPASVHFSERLLQYVGSLVDDYKEVKGEEVEATDALVADVFRTDTSGWRKKSRSMACHSRATS